jgi:hypothetical protein
MISTSKRTEELNIIFLKNFILIQTIISLSIILQTIWMHVMSIDEPKIPVWWAILLCVVLDLSLEALRKKTEVGLAEIWLFQANHRLPTQLGQRISDGWDLAFRPIVLSFVFQYLWNNQRYIKSRLTCYYVLS